MSLKAKPFVALEAATKAVFGDQYFMSGDRLYRRRRWWFPKEVARVDDEFWVSAYSRDDEFTRKADQWFEAAGMKGAECEVPGW